MLLSIAICIAVAIYAVRAIKSGISINSCDMPDKADTPSNDEYTRTTPDDRQKIDIVIGQDENPVNEDIDTANPAVPASPAKRPESTVFRSAENAGRKLYGLTGKPLGHSRSAAYFRKKFQTDGINAEYRNFELDDASEIRSLVDRNPGICGLNVTIPYKTDIMQYLDNIDDTAREIGAVNVIKVDRAGGKATLAGYNTDHIGFAQSLKPMLPDVRIKALVLGTGGASKAVCHALRQMGIEYDIVSRSSSFDILGYYELSPSIMDGHRLIINCTPVGMYPDTDSCPDIPYAYITPEHILFDLVYNPETTLFMQKGIEHGASVKSGFEMLQIQADEAWKIWNP